jgi:serine/threonine protein kinase
LTLIYKVEGETEMSLPTQFYAANGGDQFQSLDGYQASRELNSIVLSFMPSKWIHRQSGFWTHCIPPGHIPLEQGWKIHVAGTVSTASDLLKRLTPYFVSERIPFKYCSDLQMVRLCTSKNWERTAAGKFITVYPADLASFHQHARVCAELTSGFEGPYILTDRPYRNSKVIFYRYGGHLSRYQADPTGLKVSIMTSPDGATIPDRRVPYFVLPPWAPDPFGAASSTSAASTNAGHTLKGGRYKVEGAFRFSSLGGIYYGKDTYSGRDIVIREQRPHLGVSPTMLDKEGRILLRLHDTNIAPAYVDIFEEQTHKFLVQERLFANNIWDRTIDMMWGDPDGRTPNQLLDIIRNTLVKVIDGLEKVHSHLIVLRDMTRTNILFTDEDDEIKFIDYELAFELDREDPLVPGGTFGYRSPQQASNAYPDVQDDLYALGSLIVDLCTVTASGLDLHRSGTIRALRQTLSDLGLPGEIADIASALLNPVPQLRPRLSDLRDMVSRLPNSPSNVGCDNILVSHSCITTCYEQPAEALEKELSSTLKGITDFILNSLTLKDSEKLWPSSPDVFVSNSISFRFGAAGILHFLKLVQGDFPAGTLDWVRRAVKEQVCPIGFYSGLSGAAYALLEAGHTDLALEILSKCSLSELEVPGLYEGASGWGMAQLHFWCADRDHSRLEEAIRAAQWLTDRTIETPEGFCWRHDENVHLGLGRGASGIGLFFLYLHRATGEQQYLQIAQQAINYDINHVTRLGSRILVSDIVTDDPHRMRTPGTFYGTAGVGTAAVRLFALNKDPSLLNFLEQAVHTLSSRYTNKIWQDWGLAGCGEFLIDCHRFLGDKKYFHSACYLAQGILPFKMERPGGIVFPGSDLLRISCDFAVGSAGIGVFFHRILTGKRQRTLLPDSLLPTAVSEHNR